ncbi:MarR family transcriptional regulator [Curtobacterium sp. MCBD17_023]|uniref:MarR family transcriptional regulator n=1 Tax=Curtobacterium sp. MCBD17_023 TaxID=2175657 RepID=UPI000D90708F|nr:hypothetical protein DEI84_12940 [Curtobacterium sp. MCBD17_023]
MHLTTAGVTKLVDRLSSAERVERRPNPRDRRSVCPGAYSDRDRGPDAGVRPHAHAVDHRHQ